MTFPRTFFPGFAFAFSLFSTAAPIHAELNYATPYVFTTLAGSDVRAYADGTGTDARFFSPWGVAVDKSGNVYVADSDNRAIRKITPAGVVSTFAGSPNMYEYRDGVGTNARFLGPGPLAFDPQGNLLVGDDHLLRKITPAGEVSTAAGAYDQRGYNDGPVASATFGQISGVVADSTGVILIADPSYKVIRQIGLDRVVSTLAGGGESNADGVGRESGFPYMSSIALAPDGGSLVVVDSLSNQLRRVTRAGVVTTIAGVDRWTSDVVNVATDGPAATAHFNSPSSAAIDANGNIFVTDWASGLIRKITPSGDVSTIAGDPAHISGGVRKYVDGIGREVSFHAPACIAIDSKGTLYVTDGSTVRKGRLATAPVISTQPQNLTVTVGDSVQFSVVADGAPDPTYQWYVNDAPFTGATSRTLSFSAARSTDAGNYKVVVTNSLGTMTSSTATLTVKTASSSGPSGSPGTGASGGGSKGGGGGGAPSLGFIFAVSVLAGARWFLVRRTKRGALTSPRL